MRACCLNWYLVGFEKIVGYGSNNPSSEIYEEVYCLVWAKEDQCRIKCHAPRGPSPHLPSPTSNQPSFTLPWQCFPKPGAKPNPGTYATPNHGCKLISFHQATLTHPTDQDTNLSRPQKDSMWFPPISCVSLTVRNPWNPRDSSIS